MDFRILDPNAAARGVEQVNQWADAAAMRRAGARLAEDDSRGARDVLNRNGLLGQAMNVLQNEWAVDNRRIAEEDRTRERAQEDQQLQLEQEAREAQVLGTMAQNLQAVMRQNGAEAVLPAFDQMASSWVARGAQPEQIAQMRAALEQDPDSFLTAVAGASREALQRYQMATVGRSAVVFDKQTGTVTEQFRSPDIEQVDPTKDIYEIPGVGGMGGGAQGGGAPSVSGGTATEAMQSLFPNVRITGGDRLDPEHNRSVGGAPNSWHMQAGRAVDIAPIPGETVQGVREKLEAAGWTVHEAIDETRRTNGTGPHWHFAMSPPATGQRSPQDAGSGPRLLQRGQPRQTASYRPLTAAEVAERGLPEGTSAQINTANGQVQVLRSPSAARTGQNGAPRLSPQDNGYLRDIRESADQLRGAANIYAQMETLARRIDSGGLYALPGAAEAAGALNPQIRRFMALTDQLTPAMRQGLPGAASDRDVAMFRSATPSMDKPREANLAAIAAGRAFAARQGDFAAFLEQYAIDNGTLLGAQELWNRYSAENPIFSEAGGPGGMPAVNRNARPWRSYFSEGLSRRPAQQAAPASGGRRRWNPATQRLE